MWKYRLTIYCEGYTESMLYRADQIDQLDYDILMTVAKNREYKLETLES